jgi:hypothetical protein
VHSTCGDSTGAIECLCDLGYEGSSCDTCAPGYYRNDAVNTCIPIACGGNPIEAAGLATFEDVAGFPTFDNNCRGDLPLDFGDLVLSSFGGEGSVWACDTSTFYGLSTKHVFLEAGTLGAATLGFAGPIATLVFDYGARSALALEVIADGVVVGNLTANKNASGRLTYTFATPTTLVELRSVNTTTSQIGLDNISYVPPACN